MAHTISTERVRDLVAAGQFDEAIALAYVVLSERLGTLPDGGDELYASMFTPVECQALENVLEWATEALP
jgi:hypothetical protein